MPPTFLSLALSLSCEPVVRCLCQMEDSEDKRVGENTPEAPTPFPCGASWKEGEPAVPSTGTQCPELWPACPGLQLGSGPPLIWKSP